MDVQKRDIEKRINAAFQELGERRTEPRRAIAKNLIRLGHAGAAFSADELLKKLRRTNPRIGRATVYRSIDKLVRMKVLDRIEFADGTHSFRLCESDGHHHHLACTKCHRVIELDFCLESDMIAAIGKRESFEIDDHSITLFGLCRECRH
ncbi:MAG TPA: Fur family transcriptional regulator [Spirochaetia bacterium]|nr:Fur family transcriptional regulator [Spirochaetia bacterium]